jgi:uncharacterized repeat protein (TIGR03843 family)
MSPHELTSSVDPLQLLRDGDVEVEGRMPWSSNATFLVTVRADGDETKAIYKPGRGERPLWDFPRGLYRREVAAWALSEALGFGIVPPTVMRDGPFGEGSLQWFVPSDFEQHYFTLYENRPDLHDTLRTICAFDLVANNTDRKSGHCLLGLDGKVWAIDNGLCFAPAFKLRTVIWEFSGQLVPAPVLDCIGRLCDGVPDEVGEHLDEDEIDALLGRVRMLLAKPVFPSDTTGHRYPWPLV